MFVSEKTMRPVLCALGLALATVAVPTTANAHHWHHDYRYRAVHPGYVHRYAPPLQRYVVRHRSARHVVFVPYGYRFSGRRGFAPHFHSLRDYRRGRFCNDRHGWNWKHGRQRHRH